MIFFDCTKEINKDSELYNFLLSTLNNLYKQLDLQKNKKDNLIIWTNKIADICVEDSNNIDTTALLSNIEDIKNNIDNIRSNIEDINKLIASLKDIISKIDSSNNLKDDINLSLYYTLYIEKQNIISQKDINLETLLGKIYQYSNLCIQVKKEENQNLAPIIQVNTTETAVSLNNKECTEKSKTCKNEIKENQNIKQELSDNDTLIISEIQGKVFLPYKISDLEVILKENPKKYDSIETLVNKNYIIPLSKYKNSSLSRFREAFLLMKEREKASFSSALDLALELTFKYNLNPAIISACKNLDELDVYLDCLDEMNLEDFKIFNIKYEIAPMKI